MPPISASKVFNIPFLGGAATVACLIKYINVSNSATGLESRHCIIVQYNTDGTTTPFFGEGDFSLPVSVSDGIMTVKLSYLRGYNILDCRCCLIPGDPFV